MSLPSPTISTTSLPVFLVPGPDSPYQVKFLPLPQQVEVPAGSTGILECGVSNPGVEDLVSWLRSSDLSVLTVGSLVFSSDPRVGVVTGQNTWSLSISRVGVEDQGEYGCQVNTRPRITWYVQLVVKEEQTQNNAPALPSIAPTTPTSTTPTTTPTPTTPSSTTPTQECPTLKV